MLEDSIYSLVRAYEALPSPVGTLLGCCYRSIPARIKFGGAYAAFQDLLSETESWDRRALEEYRWRSLQETLKYAARKVPWYGRLWAEHGVRVQDVSAPEDMAKLPCVTKGDVRDHSEQFMSVDARPSNVLTLTTSGSTGEPLRLRYVRGVTRSRERAFIGHLWRRVGYWEGARVAVFRGFLVRGRERGRLWRRDAARNRWIFSTFDMSEGNCRAMIAELKKVRPEFLHVYPSALTTLASFMLNEGLAGSLPFVRAVLAGSENLHPWQLDLVRRAFGESVQVMRWYGCGEQASLAGSCEFSQAYHVYPQYSFTEVVREDGQPAQRPGDVGEIVGTTFDNWVMPLVRYRTADRARVGASDCACGRPYPLLDEVLGRTQNWVSTRTGERIPFAPVLFGIHSGSLSAVRRFQFVQSESGLLEVWLVPWPGTTKVQLAAVVREFEKRLAPNFTLEVHETSDIELLPGGKHEYLLQKLEARATG